MGEDIFRKGLRAAVRGLFQGVLSIGEFDEVMEKTLRRNLRQAWAEGALECGINEDELSEGESKALDAFILAQFGFIPGLTVVIQENSKSDEPDLARLFERVEMWVERYPEAKANGQAMACADEKTEFVFGPTKEHCSTCSGLRGRVYRNSVWLKNEAVPPHNWNFACRGGCQCRLKPTDKPITRGRFPVGLLR